MDEQETVRVRHPELNGEGWATEALKADLAVRRILGGEVELDPVQASPPFPLLDEIEKCWAAVPPIGPEANNPKVIDKISQSLIRDGVRQTYCEGESVHWHKGITGLTRAVQDIVWKRACVVGDPLEQANAASERYRLKRAFKISLKGKVSTRRMQEERLVPGGGVNFLDHTQKFYQFDSNWFEYHERIAALEYRIGEIVKSALSNGQAIAVEDLANGTSRVIHPSQAATARPISKTSRFVFCLSRDLPREWFCEDLHKRRNRAAEWMTRTYQHFRSQGRRATAKDIKFVATEKFLISDTAARETWKTVSRKVDAALGNPRKDQRVSIDEIRELE